MKKFLSAVALAAAGLTAQSTAHSAPEDWVDDPTVVFHEVKSESCTKPVDGQASTMILTVEVLAVKESWDKAMAGKSPAEQQALKEKMLTLTAEGLKSEFAPRMGDFTQKDIEGAYGMDSAQFKSDPYRTAVNNAFSKVSDDVRKATGIENFMGVDAYPKFKPGCELK